jgi:hypothetical protein
VAKRVLETKWWIGDTVYRKVDTDNKKCLIVNVTFCPDGFFTYRIATPDGETVHYEMELDDEPNWCRKEED